MSFIVKAGNDKLLLLPPLPKVTQTTIPRTSPNLGPEFWFRLETTLNRPLNTAGKKLSSQSSGCMIRTDQFTTARTRNSKKRESLARLRKKEFQYHLTGSTYRKQRIGPSCDHCSKQKVKCDAFIQVIEENGAVPDNCEVDSSGRITDPEIIKKYLSDPEIDSGFILIGFNNSLIKFRKCTFCQKNKLEPCYSRGYIRKNNHLIQREKKD